MNLMTETQHVQPGRSSPAYWPITFNNPRLAQGGHFAAWEQSRLVLEEIRASLRPPRKSIDG